MSIVAEAYEKSQNWNFLLSWAHSIRYRHVIRALRPMTGRPFSVLEIGCAHGKLYDVLKKHFDIEYTGIDPNDGFIIAANNRHHSGQFRVGTAQEFLPTLDRAPDVIVCLETLEHIPERDVVRIIEAIGEIKPKLFLCSVPVEIGPAVAFKNIASAISGYRRHKHYTIMETINASLYRLDAIPPHRRSHKGFDWRWLAHTIRCNMAIKNIWKSPLSWLPAWLSISVFFVTTPNVSQR